MATTTGGTPYVQSSDLVSGWPATSLSVGNKVDTVASGTLHYSTGNHTITVAQILAGVTLVSNSSGAKTYTLPSAALVDGMQAKIFNINTGTVTVNGGTILGQATIPTQYGGLTLYYYSGTWYSNPHGPAATLTSGLTLISTTAFSASAAININNCFTSTYDNYRVILNATAAAGDPAANIRLRVSGADDSSTNYAYQYMYSASTSTGALRGTGQTQYQSGYFGTGQNICTMDIINPYLVGSRTSFINQVFNANGTTTPENGLCAGEYFVNKLFDGFSIIPASSTFTGTVRIYGYQNS